MRCGPYYRTNNRAQYQILRFNYFIDYQCFVTKISVSGIIIGIVVRYTTPSQLTAPEYNVTVNDSLGHSVLLNIQDNRTTRQYSCEQSDTGNGLVSEVRYISE